jgi:diguanylate cyclase (GGDEF)-like protein/PAS domain S-box-containing protein
MWFVIFDYVIVLVLLFCAIFLVRRFVFDSQQSYLENTLPVTQLGSVHTSVTDLRSMMWKAGALRDRKATVHTLRSIQSGLSEINRTWASYYPEGVSNQSEAVSADRLQLQLLPKLAKIAEQVRFQLANGNYSEAARLVRDEQPFFDNLDATLREMIASNHEQSADEVQSQTVKFRGVFWITLAIAGLVCIFLCIAVFRLVSQRNKAQEAVRSNTLLTDQLFGAMPAIGMLVDPDANIVRVNSAFTRVTGYTNEQVQDMKTLALRSERNSPTLFADLRNSLRATGQWKGEFWYRKKNGEHYLQNSFITGVRGADGRVTHYALVGSDITLRRQQEEEMRWSATHDSLTGLPNRKLFGDRLEHAMSRARRSSANLAVFFIDLDGFKSINDTKGHRAGDHVLVTVAKRLQGALRESDTVARLGGDEFAVILEDCSGEDASRIAGLLISNLGEPIELENDRGTITGSIGISLFPRGGDLNAEELVSQADQAMYEAKHSGKNQFRVFAPLQRIIA